VTDKYSEYCVLLQILLLSLWKESVKSYSQQCHQYEQNKQISLALSLGQSHKCLGQSHKCSRVKPAITV
jgi:hypothetical protein